MPEEHETIETRSSDSPEVHQQTKFMAWFEKAFPWLLVSGAALGLTLMIILPIIFFQEKTGDQLKAQSDLRLALLYTTGGVIAALGLLETYRKNTNDRAKANADIKAALKNQEHQAEVLKEQIRQFDENAFKERKAERRERYTKAVEQLGDEKAPIRMGGVYTLVGLVDEWLEEKSLSDDERFKEGQVIINNLCAYIRSPFTLATRYDELSKDSPSSDGIYKDNQQEFYTDKAEFKAEADVRLGIIKEIHDRIQGPDKNTPGAWSDFEYDFSGSTFFYPIDLTKSYYAKPINFSGSTYQGEASFTGSTYNDVADFSGSIFYQKVYFGADGYSNSFSCFTNHAPQFYDETNHKNTLFGSPNNDFTVENGRGYPIYRNFEGLPLGCSFLTTEQKEYLADKFQEIEKINNKLREVKDPKEKEELLKKLQALNEELYKWREEATTVQVEGTALRKDNN